MDTWLIVPSRHRHDLDYFDRQRDMYSKWMHLFDPHLSAMRYDDSFRRFESELDRVKRELLKLDTEPADIEVAEPFITDADGNRKLQLRFNVNEFAPEEIAVKTNGQDLLVQAKHVEDSPGKKVHIELHKKYKLPENVDPKMLKSTLSRDGVLQIEAPAPPEVEAPKENLVPIEKL
ncbi:HSPB1-like protein [Mya arenaria]|uniref:HSPB1-like protein n=1 Tax=Mya arenaria TaxID=6604 RepID=A0ABY7FJF8_MYAAR|nr:heat shock protein beta-1-like [Mya arenaria]WAR22330.1 HSPB1-like protein [Mya arenaria]